MDRPDLGPALLLRGDARTIPLADNTVDLIVTSPPYWALRSYSDGGEHYAGQIGDEPTPGEFVDALLEVTRECVRVLKPSGSLFVNLGDKYAASERGPDGKSSGLSNGAQFRVGSGRSVTASGVRKKSLLMIPARYSIRCVDELQLILRAQIVWSKTNGMPESVSDRVRRSHEEWFHFTKQQRYYSAVDELRTPHAKPWTAGSCGGHAAPVGAMGDQHDGLSESSPHPLGALPGSVWDISTEPLKLPEWLGVQHYAAFPTEWPHRLIRGWCPPAICTACEEARRPVVERESELLRSNNTTGRPKRQDISGDRNNGWNAPGYPKTREHARITGYECACPDTSAPTRRPVVLDPFGGTGTTALVARALGRAGISLDMSWDYCRAARWRTRDRAQIAKARRAPKPREEVTGQESLLDLLAAGS